MFRFMLYGSVDRLGLGTFFFIGTDRGNKYKVTLEPLFDRPLQKVTWVFRR